MANKNYIFIEVVDNNIDSIQQSKDFTSLLNTVIDTAMEYLKNRGSEAEIEDWKDEFNEFTTNLPTSYYEYTDNTGDVGYSYAPRKQELNFWYHKRDNVDLYIKSLDK